MKLLVIVLALFTFANAQEMIGNFYYESTTDPFTDEKIETLVLMDSDANDYRDGALTYYCADNDLLIMFYSDEFLNNEDTAMIEYRFDKGDVRSKSAFLTNDGTTVILPAFNGDGFVEKSLESTILAVRLTNYNDENFTYIYDLTGFAEAVLKLGCAAQYLNPTE